MRSNPFAARILATLERSQGFTQHREEPVRFIERVIGVTPLPWQCDVLNALVTHSRIAVRSGNGVGKSALGSFALLWYLATRPYSKVPTTAGVGRQVKEILWSEAHKWFNRATALHETFELQDVAIRHKAAPKEWFAIGFSTDEAAAAEGWHADHLLWIIDEAKAVEPPIWEAVNSTLTGSDNRVLALSVPGAAQGEFHRVFTRLRETWKAFVIPAAQRTSNGRYEPAVSIVSQASIDDKARTWGPESPLFRARVLGEFIDQTDDTLILLSWIEQTVQRGRGLVPTEPRVLGADIARYGSSETVFAVRAGQLVLPLHIHTHQDTMQTAGQIVALARTERVKQIRVDVVGVGAGVVDRLHEVAREQNGLEVVAVNVGEAATDTERFANLRSELWWGLREALDPRNPDALGLPDDEMLASQLAGVKYRYTSSGQIQVESKDDMRRRGLVSPDRADAVVLTIEPTSRSFNTWMDYLDRQIGDQKRQAQADLEERARSQGPGIDDVTVDELRARGFTRQRW